MYKRNGTTRGTALLSAALLVVASTMVLAGTSFGQIVPKIAFLNPSSFASAGERGLIVSDAAPTVGPGCCEGAGSGYRLSAWVSNAPPGSSVFFQVVQRAIDIEITETSSPSPNMWEANWSIPPEILDGTAKLYAYLVLNEEPIAVAEADVTIMRVQEHAHLNYPAPGGAFGTYAALADSLTEGEAATRTPPAGVVDAWYNDEADIAYVRALYTTSDPGSEPVWNVCGTETNTASGALNGIRCTVKPEDQLRVTAIAAVANDSPDDYENRFNQAGDAVAVSNPYAQDLTNFSMVTAGVQRVERETVSKQYFCSESESAVLKDQVGRQIVGANVDVHAAGPSDTLKFNTFSTVLTINQAPDRGTHVEEEAFDCTGQRTAAPAALPSNANPDTQGEHPRFGAPDRKHIESLPGGTNDLGIFGFRVRATVEGMTEWTMWVDEADDGCLANDDTFTSGEMFVHGAIGWSQDAFASGPQPYEAFVPCTPAAGPSPSPSPTTPEVDGSRTISATVTPSPVVIGKPARFKGKIDAVASVCENLQKVVLKVRKPGQRFVTRKVTTTDERGRFTLSHIARTPRDYRVVAPPTSTCDRARSTIIRLRNK